MLRIILAFPNLQFLNISGGEPFLNIENLKKLLQIIQYNKIYYKYLTKTELKHQIEIQKSIKNICTDFIFDRMLANLKVTIYTCGYYPKNITNRYLLDIINLLENENDKIIFSLHTIDGTINRKLNKDFYNPEYIVQESIRLIKSHDENKLDKDNEKEVILSYAYEILTKDFSYFKKFGQPGIEFNYVPNKITVKHFENVLKFIDGLDKKYKRLNILRNVAQGKQNIEENNLDIYINEFYEYYIYKWRYVYPNISVRFGSSFNCVKLGAYLIHKCTAGEDKLLINSRGYIFPCEAFKFLETRTEDKYFKPKYTLKIPETALDQYKFNIFLSQYINSSIIFDYLYKIRTNYYERVEECFGCPRYKECIGGCAEQRELHNRDIGEGPDPMCKSELAKKNLLMKKKFMEKYN